MVVPAPPEAQRTENRGQRRQQRAVGDFPADVGNRRLQSALRGAHRRTLKSIHSAPSWVVSQALWANEFKAARLKFHTLRPGPLSRSV